MNAFFVNPDVAILGTGLLVAASSALLGTFLVLRRSSLLTDAISHAVLLGIVLVYLLTGNAYSPLFVLGAALAGLGVVLLSELLASSRRVKTDAAIGLVYPLLFAVAVVLINVFARNVHIDQDAVLLGEIGFVWIDTTTVLGLELPKAMLTLLAVTLANLLFVLLFYKELKLTLFDAGLAAALGFSPVLVFYLLLGLTSVTAVAAFDAVGAVLFVAFVIVPSAAAYLLTDELWRMLAYGVLIGMASSLLGYPTAVLLDVSIGGMMALYTGLFLLLALLLGPRYGLWAQAARRRGERERNAVRTLLVHLYHHERDAAASENAVEALQSHLRWSPQEARSALERGLGQGLLLREGALLRLTSAGRAQAREVLEPGA
mgnify:CR=1 FL=1